MWWVGVLAHCSRVPRQVLTVNILVAADYWVTEGIAVIPVQHRTKKPLVKWKPYQSQLPTVERLLQWFGNGTRNLGLVTGWRGLTVIDFDDYETYMRWMLWAARVGGYTCTVARQTYRVQTARGMHIYTRLPEATRTRGLLDAGGQRVGVDIKSRSGYVLAPPSVHPTGAQYTAINPHAPIMAIAALSDILPAAMLVEDVRPHSEVRLPKVKQPMTDDPWQAAEQPEYGEGAVDRIKEKLKIEDFFPQRAKRGRYWMTRCPFHDDKNPSMWLWIEMQRCGCYAGCTPKSLDVIDLYARLNDLSNTEAIRVLVRSL